MAAFTFQDVYQHFLGYFTTFRDYANKDLVSYAGFQQGKPTGMASSAESLYQFMLKIPNEDAVILNAGAGASSWVLRKFFCNVICTDEDAFYISEVQRICALANLPSSNFIAGIENVTHSIDYCYYDYGNSSRIPNFPIAVNLTKHLLYVDDADTRKDCEPYRQYVYQFAADNGLLITDCVEAIDEYGRWGVFVGKNNISPISNEYREPVVVDNLPSLSNAKRLLIKYATRKRPKQLLAALENIQNTIGTTTTNYQIIVSVDSDDLESIEALSANLFPDLPLDFYVAKQISKVSAINRDMDKARNWDWLINMSDDMVFVVNNWYDKMLADIQSVFGDSTDFFAHYSDGFVGDKLPTMSIMGKAYYYRTGYIYHPGYKSVSCDAEAMYVAMMLGKHHYFGDYKVYFKHNHPANAYGQLSDDTYNSNEVHATADATFYHSRRLQYFGIKDPVTFPYTI